VNHVNAGLLYYYGNSEYAPFSELFYVGGANSIRAFGVRTIGPGAYIDLFGNKQFSYMLQNGDIKILTNVEYRTRLFGNLNGAIFLDAGNVWQRTADYVDPSEAHDEYELIAIAIANELERRSQFKFSRFFDQLAVGTGVGLRYDLGFLVIRIDWGLALHFPYDTGRSGYFNIPNFHDAQTIHFAIGYPF
jgi:outer membrane protein assembly factor BamA